MVCSEAIFDWWVLNGVVVINDLHNSENNSKSVTNDIENVIAIIAANNNGLDLFGGIRVIYCDTDNIYDEILIKDGKFDGFRLLNAKGLKQALINLRQ